MRSSLAMLVLLFAATGFVTISAQAATRPTTVTATAPAEFDAQVAAIRAEIKPGGLYGGIKPDDREAVEANLNKMSALLHKKGSADALDAGEKTELFNAQEKTNATLTNNEQNRLICTNEIKSGTHFPVKTCQTVAERDAIHRQSQDGYRNQFMKNGASQERLPPGAR